MKNPKIDVQAPGKILWIGGYSVLERPNIAFVSAVNAYVTATINHKSDMKIKLDAPQLKSSVSGEADDEGKITGEAAPELLLMKTSAEVALRYAISLGAKPSGFSITTNSDPAFAYSLNTGKIVKSGLGSSAAVTVATVGAVLKFFGMDAKGNDALHKLAQTAHSIATGKVGSGFDVAAAAHGSILYTRYSPDILKTFPKDYSNQNLNDLVRSEWDYTIKSFSLPKELKLLFANFGEAMITTKAIGSVSDFRTRDPHSYAELIQDINDENLKAVNALKKVKKGNMDSLEEFKTAFDHGRSLTKKLGLLSNVGIEPDDCTELIEESKKNGAFVAKLPGAGGKDSVAALSLDDNSYASLKKYWGTRKELSILDIKTVASGAV